MINNTHNFGWKNYISRTNKQQKLCHHWRIRQDRDNGQKHFKLKSISSSSFILQNLTMYFPAAALWFHHLLNLERPQHHTSLFSLPAHWWKVHIPNNFPNDSLNEGNLLNTTKEFFYSAAFHVLKSLLTLLRNKRGNKRFRPLNKAGSFIRW